MACLSVTPSSAELLGAYKKYEVDARVPPSRFCSPAFLIVYVGTYHVACLSVYVGTYRVACACSLAAPLPSPLQMQECLHSKCRKPSLWHPAEF